MQLDIKAMQDDVEEEKAEKETPIHVGLPMLLCSITISIPRLQIWINHIGICCKSLCSGKSTTNPVWWGLMISLSMNPGDSFIDKKT